jgi:single-strand DNA-binding protein
MQQEDIMASLNKVILLGNLTRDPDLRYTPNGTVMASFGLAVNRRYRQEEAWHDEVCYVDVVTFGRQAETVGEYLSKGHLAMIEGRLQWRSWETDEGLRRSKHEVVATHVQFMPGGSRGPTRETDQPTRPGGSGLDEGLPPTDDDIPFVRSDLHEGIRRDRWEPVA